MITDLVYCDLFIVTSFVKLVFEEVVNRQTRTGNQNFEGVPNPLKEHKDYRGTKEGVNDSNIFE